MAYTGIMCTLLEFQYKCGAGVSATAIAEAYANSFVAQAESYVNVATRTNWSDAYSGLNADVKHILTDTVSSLAAMYAIQYDMTGYGLSYATAMLNHLWTHVQDNLKLLQPPSQVEYITGA